MSMVEVRHLYVSSGHNFFGHHGRAPDNFPAVEVTEFECVAGHGIRGDRFFDYRDNYKGQITFFSLEIFEDLCRALELHNAKPDLVRRNVIVSGADLNSLVGRTFELQGIRFEATAECKPCYWMDRALRAGAERFLEGQGGLRARILTSGLLRASAPVHSTAL